MDNHLSNEISFINPELLEEVLRADPLPEPPSRFLTAGLLLLVTVLFILALAGGWSLISAFRDGRVLADDVFYLSLALTFLAPLFMGGALTLWTRMAEQSRLAVLYKNRIEQLQNRLTYRDDMLRLVANHQPGAITIFDRHNRYWFVNERASEALGKKQNEVVGQPPIKILDNQEAKKLEVRLAEARAADRPVECVDRVVDEKGQTRFIQMHYEVVAPSADMLGCVLVSEDDLTSLIVERERRERMLKQVIDTLVAVVDRRDPYAAGHSGRVGQLSRALAEEMDLPSGEVDAAEIAGSLMNFGKVLVSRHILTKTTPLSPEELQRVRDSILTSADILAIIGFDGPVVPTLRQVLERYDGAGAPEGLAGDEILTTARIVAVANAYVALVSPRAHRDGLPLVKALDCMQGEAGKAFDQKILIALSNYIENRANKLDWLTTVKAL